MLLVLFLLSAAVVRATYHVERDPPRTATYHHTWSIYVEQGADPHHLATELDMVNLGPIGVIPGHFLFRHNTHPRYSPSHADRVTRTISAHPAVISTTQQTLLSRGKRQTFTSQFNFNDPYFSKQWYLYGDYNNVTGAWAQDVTGRGIVVTILDDGLEHTHPDLELNYDEHASTDLNGNDDDPMPRYDITNENKHGTRCAGEVASVAGNTYCGVGAAYNSNIGGIRMLDGDVTDAVEASALGLRPEYIDIYSSSWGPDDDGKTVDGPGALTKDSIYRGIRDGRGGRGSLFVWASGNGGVHSDNCNCDGYTNSIYTISIGSVSETGQKPWYAEECTSTHAVTYSSGGSREKQIMSTDLRSKCTERHTGTSAAAPLAAGMFALLLQAYPQLTWRDVQHLIVRTSKARNLQDAQWVVNTAGYSVSHKFGFGVIDAGALVELARVWNNVPEQEICTTPEENPNSDIEAGSTVTFSMVIDGCADDIVYLEHVQCPVTISADRRGDISLFLISPAGTQSTILSYRKLDSSGRGFQGWPFMTVHNWGEDPRGSWRLAVKNNGARSMTLRSWSLVLHGTSSLPGYRNTSREIASSGNLTNESERVRDERNGGGEGLARSLILVVVAVLTRELRRAG